MTEKTGGAAYGETALSVDDKMKQMFPELKPTNRPSVVWMADVSDEKTQKKIDGTILGNEAVGIGLKRFNCYRVSVLDMPDGELKDKYLRQLPAFVFYDPAGKELKTIKGKRATSLSMFTKTMEKTWNMSFTVKQKVFSKQMKDILDRLDKYDTQLQVLDKKQSRLDERPNRSLKRQVDAEREILDKMKASIEEDEKKIMVECTLRPEFLPEQDAESR